METGLPSTDSVAVQSPLQVGRDPDSLNATLTEHAPLGETPFCYASAPEPQEEELRKASLIAAYCMNERKSRSDECTMHYRRKDAHASNTLDESATPIHFLELREWMQAAGVDSCRCVDVHMMLENREQALEKMRARGRR